MNLDRRLPEASSVRHLFHQQLDYLSRLIDQHNNSRAEARKRESTELAAVEHLVDSTDRRMRIISNYRNKLRSSTRLLLNYVHTLAHTLPAPLAVSTDRFLHDPQLNAFFVNREAIRQVFSRSHALQTFFANPLHGDMDLAFAVLFMTRKEKEVLRTAMVNGLIRRDVKQTTVSFTDHNVTQPSRNEAEVRSALERFLFESYVEYVNYQLTRLSATSDNAPEAPNLRDPSVYLSELRTLLEQPEQLLRLASDTIRLNRIGIKLAENAKEVSHQITVNEIGLGRRTHEVVTLVTYRREEMISQDELLHQAHLSLGV
jgi:hypothetical protein